MKIVQWFFIFLTFLVSLWASFKLGSMISEVKTSLIFSMDDMASLNALKKEAMSDDSIRVLQKLKERYVWRVSELKAVYEASPASSVMSIDKDIDHGFIHFEKLKGDSE